MAAETDASLFQMVFRMSPKSTLLTTLSVLAFGASLGMSPAEAQFREECRLIQMSTDIQQLQEIASRREDPCSTIALERLVDLVQPANGNLNGLDGEPPVY